MLEKIQDSFNESIQIQIATADALPKELSLAANLIVERLLQGKKIIACGYGRSYANAQLLVSNLLQRYDMARPSLAAHLLQLDGMLTGYAEQDNDLNQLYKKQLQILAKEGDVLVVFSPLGQEEIILNAIRCANNEQLSVIAFTSSRNDHIQGLLEEQDVELKIPSINEMRVIECHQFCTNLLCELVDNLLFNPTSH